MRNILLSNLTYRHNGLQPAYWSHALLWHQSLFLRLYCGFKVFPTNFIAAYWSHALLRHLRILADIDKRLLTLGVETKDHMDGVAPLQ